VFEPVIECHDEASYLSFMRIHRLRFHFLPWLWASDMATKQAERYHNIVEQFEHVARASATPWLAARRNHFTASA